MPSRTGTVILVAITHHARNVLLPSRLNYFNTTDEGRYVDVCRVYVYVYIRGTIDRVVGSSELWLEDARRPWPACKGVIE